VLKKCCKPQNVYSNKECIVCAMGKMPVEICND